MKKRTLLLATPIVVLTLLSLEASIAYWHLIDHRTALGVWIYVLPDLAISTLGVAPGYFTLADTAVYLVQSTLVVGLAHLLWSAWRARLQAEPAIYR